MKVNSVMKSKTDQQVLHPVQKHFQQQQQQQPSAQLSKNLSPENMKEFQLGNQNHEKVFSENTSNKYISPMKAAQLSFATYTASKQNQQDKQYQDHQQQLKQQYANQGQPKEAQQQQQQFEEYSEEEIEGGGEHHLPEEIPQEEERLYAQAQMEQLSNHLHENNQNINSNASNNGNTAHQGSNSNNSFNSADEVVAEDTAAKEDSEEVDKFAQKQLVSDPDKYFEKIIELNDVAALKLNDGQQKEALSILYKAEKMLEFAASCGKVIDRNLIIVVLYNRACAYQSLWILDKCSKYIDGVIYNLEMSLKEEDTQEDMRSSMNDSARGGLNSQKSIKRSKQIERELLAYKIKKQTFLVKSYLQCCAILSQQGFHVKALETANEGANILKRIFKECYEFCRDTVKENEQNVNSSTMLKSPRQTFSNGLGQNQNVNNNMNGGRQPNQGNSMKTSQNSSQYQSNQQLQQQAASATGDQTTNQQQPYHLAQNGGPNYFHKDNQGTASAAQQGGQMPTDYSMDSIMSSRKSMQQAKEEVQFQKLVVEYAFSILQDIQALIINDDSEKSQLQHYKEAKKSLYFWKNNPDNNEKHIRQELNVPTKLNEEETRSILGVQNGSEWIEGFNIGSIMHMIPVQYEEFSFFGDVMYEISKKMILEKVIYLSISYFTIATEIRFIEIDKNKNQNQKGDGSKNLDTEGFKQSQIYHLKSIQIVCKHITCKSPYINHLITSYHKHYNQNLETILEESFMSAADNTVTGNNHNHEALANSQQFEGFNYSSTNQQLFQSQQQQQQMSILNPGEDSVQEGQRFEELVNIFVNGMSEDDQTPNYVPPNIPLVLSGANGINQSTNNLHSITKNNNKPAVTQLTTQMVNLTETKKNINQEQTEKKKHSKNSQSARASTSSSQIVKKNHHSSSQQQQQQVSESKSSRPVAYFPPTSKQSFRKEKKTTFNSNKSTNSTSKTPINIDFNSHSIIASPLLSPSPKHSTQQQQYQQQQQQQQQHLQQQYLQHLQQHNQQTSINSSLALQMLHKNIGQFFSNDNSQKNTPRGIFNIRKSTPTVESSNSQDLILHTEPSSHSQLRNPPKSSKKPKESYSNKTSAKISMENVTDILKNNLIASYSRTFLAQQNGPLQLSQSKSAMSQNSSENQSIKLPTSAVYHRSNIPLSIEFIGSSKKLKEKMYSEQSELRSGQIERIMPQPSSKLSSSLQSSKPSTATSQTARQKKQQQKGQQSESNDSESQGSSSQQKEQQALQDDLRNKINAGNSSRQQLNNYPKETKLIKEQQALGVLKPNGNVSAQIDNKRSVLESIESFQQSGQHDKQNNQSKYNHFPQHITSSASLKSSNLLSIKNLDKETLQKLLKETQNVPKLNLHGLKPEDVKFYSPRGPTKSALPAQKHIF